jgi:hypothetical protein
MQRAFLGFEVLQQLEILASQEGTTAGDLIRRIVGDHLMRTPPPTPRPFNVPLPLISASETGPIQPLTDKDADFPDGTDRPHRPSPHNLCGQRFVRFLNRKSLYKIQRDMMSRPGPPPANTIDYRKP